MGSTTYLALPYPELADSDNVPKDVKALAEKVETYLYRPSVELTASALTSIAVSAYTKVALATTSHLDGGSAFFTVSSSVITIVQAGRYDLSAFCGFVTGGTAGNRYVAISKNGTAVHVSESGTASGNQEFLSVNAGEVTLAAGDTIQLVAFQSGNAGGLNTEHTANNVSRLMVRKVG